MNNLTTVFVFTDNLFWVASVDLYFLGLVSFALSGLLKKKTEEQDFVLYLLGQVLGWLGVVVVGLMAVFMAKADYEDYFEAKAIYDNQRYSVVEGTVALLHSQPFDGHDKGDIVRVNDVEFEINGFRHTLAYHQTVSHWGVLQQGVYAKIYYYDNWILRIDILKP